MARFGTQNASILFIKFPNNISFKIDLNSLILHANIDQPITCITAETRLPDTRWTVSSDQAASFQENLDLERKG